MKYAPALILSVLAFIVITGCATTEQKIDGFSNGFYAGFAIERISLFESHTVAEMNSRKAAAYKKYKSGESFAPNTQGTGGTFDSFDNGYRSGTVLVLQIIGEINEATKKGDQPTPLTDERLLKELNKRLKVYLRDN
ncbi:MAG: hypothetical protein HF981_00425 [Desulfobacteraceae bacterium]|nr:hypothetical protein [Desulfobacteraceae bacterium]MBC2748833.1 hypothetical protein [Desulfobacteraceae bacterium]